jgi:hypothetical protein
MEVFTQEPEELGDNDAGDGGRQGATALGGPADKDREELRAFFKDVQVLLRDIVRRQGWLPDELRPQYEAALDALDPTFEEVDQALSDPAVNDQLGEAGLLGAAWKLKHDVWVWIKGFGHTGKRATALGLRTADTIIGSVAIFIPPAELISEGKEMVGHGIEGKALLDEARAHPEDEGPAT